VNPRYINKVKNPNESQMKKGDRAGEGWEKAVFLKGKVIQSESLRRVADERRMGRQAADGSAVPAKGLRVGVGQDGRRTSRRQSKKNGIEKSWRKLTKISADGKKGVPFGRMRREERGWRTGKGRSAGTSSRQIAFSPHFRTMKVCLRWGLERESRDDLEKRGQSLANPPTQPHGRGREHPGI